jgi:hypothetical protein
MAAITRYRHPDRCDWPQQFVASDGIILPAGAFEEDEHPYDLQSLKVPLQHRHRAWYQVLYLCWWMRLTAPDGRPYYYDVVSHTWTLCMCLCISLSLSLSLPLSLSLFLSLSFSLSLSLSPLFLCRFDCFWKSQYQLANYLSVVFLVQRLTLSSVTLRWCAVCHGQKREKDSFCLAVG